MPFACAACTSEAAQTAAVSQCLTPSPWLPRLTARRRDTELHGGEGSTDRAGEQNGAAHVGTRVYARHHEVGLGAETAERGRECAQPGGSVDGVGLDADKGLDLPRLVGHLVREVERTDGGAETRVIPGGGDDHHLVAAGVKGPSQSMKPRRIDAVVVGDHNAHPPSLPHSSDVSLTTG